MESLAEQLADTIAEKVLHVLAGTGTTVLE